MYSQNLDNVNHITLLLNCTRQMLLTDCMSIELFLTHILTVYSYLHSCILFIHYNIFVCCRQHKKLGHKVHTRQP